MMKRKKRDFKPVDFGIYDGSGIAQDEDDFGTDSYLDFVSNGGTNNERIDAYDYYDAFLDENGPRDRI